MGNRGIQIARRFQRSIRIDSDLSDPSSLEGYICSASTANVLRTMANHVTKTGQGAFTWTGPYGSGKSSLLVALGSVLGNNPVARKLAAKTIGQDLAENLWRDLMPNNLGWMVVPIVGNRSDPTKAIGESCKEAGIFGRRPKGGWSERKLTHGIIKWVNDNNDTHSGLILFIDEMGKFLEVSAKDGHDVYIFQELAEAAARSNKKLIIIGALHQAFGEYANRLARDLRDEWSKVQGRYLDMVIDTRGMEQIELISRAIESDQGSTALSSQAETVASQALGSDHKGIASLVRLLENCWPLHPTVACLLGPISKRRFGQNQRSIFGFLNSAEPFGFQDFLGRSSKEDPFLSHMLWDYLRANLESSILSSPDGHRWALAADAIERCEVTSNDEISTQILKTIAVIDLFKERSGLVGNRSVIESCFPDLSKELLHKHLLKLQSESLTIYRKFSGAHAIFAGSDFDIDYAVETELKSIGEVDFGLLQQLAGMQPVLAKRYYHRTGSMRWLDVTICPMHSAVETAFNFKSQTGSIGLFLLAIPTDSDRQDQAIAQCKKASESNSKWDVAVGLSQKSWAVVPLARELVALNAVQNNCPELAGDAVARREVSARIAHVQAIIESELQTAFNSAKWFTNGSQPVQMSQVELNELASILAEKRFPESPVVFNELLNRQKPSSSAIAAQNHLLRSMVLNRGEERLGIQGFPAEGGLFVSLLERSGLYRRDENEWRFIAPEFIEQDPLNLIPLWEATLKFLERNKSRTVSVAELHARWRSSPFGLKDGLMPVFSVAFILTQQKKLAVYQRGIYRSSFTDIDAEYLAKNADSIQLRYMDLSEVARSLLSGLASVVRDLDESNDLKDLQPIDVGRGLMSIYGKLPTWTTRTMRLSSNAVQVREIFKRAHDPNKFIFDDLPEIFREAIDTELNDEKLLPKIIEGVNDGLTELVNAYPSMLKKMENLLFSELLVPNDSPQSIAELRQRAENIQQLSGDFRLEALVGRLKIFEGEREEFESIASLTLNKPPFSWVDSDVDRASMEIASLAQKFLKAETLTRIKNRPSKRQALAVMVGIKGQPSPLIREFNVSEPERVKANDLANELELLIENYGELNIQMVLAALTELSAKYLTGDFVEDASAQTKVAS